MVDCVEKRKIMNTTVSNTSNTVPGDWKSAVVNPFFKSKGSTTDPNNYREISVLLPFAKIFERLLSS